MVNIFLPLFPSPGSRGRLEGLHEINQTHDVPFVLHKHHRRVIVTSAVVQCGECKSSTSNIFPREDSSLALEGISQGPHEIHGPLDAVF